MPPPQQIPVTRAPGCVRKRRAGTWRPFKAEGKIWSQLASRNPKLLLRQNSSMMIIFPSFNIYIYMYNIYILYYIYMIHLYIYICIIYIYIWYTCTRTQHDSARSMVLTGQQILALMIYWKMPPRADHQACGTWSCEGRWSPQAIHSYPLQKNYQSPPLKPVWGKNCHHYSWFFSTTQTTAKNPPALTPCHDCFTKCSLQGPTIKAAKNGTTECSG